jgi:cell division protein FtsW|tara:strand:- start:7238 stop:8368 length:1131 start_codon:yes stop_codon:yes gene_type:complete
MFTWIRYNIKGDRWIWLIAVILSIISLLSVYSATGSLAYQKMGGNTEYYLFKHFLLIILSFIAMWFAHKLDYKYYSKISIIAMYISLPLLLVTYQFGLNINEASRWINIPIINQAFQPSDLAKLSLIIYLSSVLSKSQYDLDNIKSLIKPFLWIGIICLFIALTNLSTSIILGVTSMLLMFIARVKIKYLAVLVLFISFGATIALITGQRGKTAISRTENFIYKKNIPFQLEQAYIAVSTGGLFGKGPGKSNQKNFLPQSYSDFIYAIIIEEYGLLMGISVLLLYLILLYRGLYTFLKSERPFGGLLSAGLSFYLVIQAITNMSVVVGLLPVTGITLPLISMGGTSQLFTGITLGIILSISRHNSMEEENNYSYGY